MYVALWQLDHTRLTTVPARTLCATRRNELRLRRAFQRDDRQMLTPFLEVDAKGALVAWLASDKRPWLGARRATWPLPSRLDAWAPIGWPTMEIHLVGCPAAQRRVRPFAVVPLLVTNKLPQKLVTTQRNLDVTDTLCLQ